MIGKHECGAKSIFYFSLVSHWHLLVPCLVDSRAGQQAKAKVVSAHFGICQDYASVNAFLNRLQMISVSFRLTLTAMNADLS